MSAFGPLRTLSFASHMSAFGASARFFSKFQEQEVVNPT